MKPCAASAGAYARLGCAVVPLHDVAAGRCSCGKPDCKSAGKHPRLNDWPKHATSDAEQVAELWDQFPNANVGIATGAISGFFCLDVDPDKGGADSLAALVAQHGDLPETPRARTGSGGTHYLFDLPDFVVTNSAGRVGLGLDVRGDGGQIVVAPSVSSKGAYTWIASPFDVRLAPAPAWLLEKIRTSTSASAKPVAPAVRGEFPPATPQVLDEARAALARHGPAIDGQGGGLHTVQAGAILTHDFALSDDEAWPLIAAWNETCQPPWDPAGLRVMLGRGRKYGKAEYGSRRTMDTETTAAKWIRDWAAQPGASVSELARRLRTLRPKDGIERAAIVAEWARVTGLKEKDLDLPPPPPADLPPNGIVLSPRLAELADASLEAIAPEIFQRGGALCEVVRHERVTIADCETARLQDLMSRKARFFRLEKSGTVEVAAPLPVASILRARRQHLGIRILEAVSTSPVMLPDGEILQHRGYNAQARLWLEPSVNVTVWDEPTRQDALDAVDVFRDLLCDFPFLEPADFSTWVAALLSPLVKAATGNAPAPLFIMTAPSPGSGKSLLAELISRIVTGNAAENRTYSPKDPGEWAKRVTAAIRSAAPINVIDNVNGPFGDETLDRLLTASVWSDRILGVSEAPPVPIVGIWIATGNNTEPVGDTLRRCAFVRLDIRVERPQERSGFKRPDLIEYTKQHRADLLAAALTILRAWHVAGRPCSELSPWGSFSEWSGVVRQALVWAGLADPILTQRRAAAFMNDAENDAHDFWISVVETAADGLPATIAMAANARDAQGILSVREQITPHSLKKLIHRFVDRPRRGKRISRDRDATGAICYRVDSL